MNGLYLITDGNDEDHLIEHVQAALKGGATVVQYRAKGLPQDRQLAMIQQLRPLCQHAGALLIINDDPELALQGEADGVHLGQDDMTVLEARKLLGNDKRIGITCRTVDQAIRAEMQGVDYIGFGAVFPTETKEDTTVVGLDALRKARRAVMIPIVAIGGMNPQNASEAIDAGADCIATYSSVMLDSDPMRAAREHSLLFNRNASFPRGKVLTIAGSDSGGGAGIQADLKTITLLGGYGASALTALTAQNTTGVKQIEALAPDFVETQATTVLDDIGADVIKTGMLYSSEIVARVAQMIKDRPVLTVVDPVFIAKGGANLLQDEAINSIVADLLPYTYLVTPNLPEAEALVGYPINTVEEMERAARDLQELGARHVLIKGGHLEDDATDVLLTDDTIQHLQEPRIDTPNTHGTGCTYSAAIATLLAQGHPLVEAVTAAKGFITRAIQTAPDLGNGHGPVNHFQGAMKLMHRKPIGEN